MFMFDKTKAIYAAYCNSDIEFSLFAQIIQEQLLFEHKLCEWR